MPDMSMSVLIALETLNYVVVVVVVVVFVVVVVLSPTNILLEYLFKVRHVNACIDLDKFSGLISG